MNNTIGQPYSYRSEMKGHHITVCNKSSTMQICQPLTNSFVNQALIYPPIHPFVTELIPSIVKKIHPSTSALNQFFYFAVTSNTKLLVLRGYY
jgi:hypothetical protein